jgi:hypothetical protein
MVVTLVLIAPGTVAAVSMVREKMNQRAKQKQGVGKHSKDMCSVLPPQEEYGNR